jgi:hypothetical protein
VAVRGLSLRQVPVDQSILQRQHGHQLMRNHIIIKEASALTVLTEIPDFNG